MKIKQAEPKFIIEMNDFEKWIEIRPFSSNYTGLDIYIMDKQYNKLIDKTNIIRDKLIKNIVYYDYEIDSALRKYIGDICNYRIIGIAADNIILSLFYACFVGKVEDSWETRNDMRKDFWKQYFEKEYEETLKLMK